MILEQLPGLCAVRDESKHLNVQRYWGSYNIPAVEEVWELSGFGEETPKWKWSHSDKFEPRAIMMKALNASVQDIKSCQKFIRHNEHGKDHVPKQYAWDGDGISSRFDLFPVGSADYALSGGIDGKVSSVSLARKMKFWAQNGPTHDDQAPFDWRKTGPYPNKEYKEEPVHVGMPDIWDFDWIMFKPLDAV